MTSYQTWPAAVLAALGAAGAAALIGSQSPADAVDSCSDGRAWVAISPADIMDSTDVRLVGYEETLEPVLAGCLDLDRLEPVTPADPRS